MSAQIEMERPTHYPPESENYALLFSKDQIQQGVKEQASRLFRRYQEQGVDEIVAVYVGDGAAHFASDLLEHLSVEGMKWIRTVSVTSKSYKDTQSTGKPIITGDSAQAIEEENVLLIEDVLDSGGTLTNIQNELQGRKPASLFTAVLMTKTSDQLKIPVPPRVDDVIFPNVRGFVVGYGLDFNDFFRELPDIYVVTNLEAVLSNA